MDEILRRELGLPDLKNRGAVPEGRGCINQGLIYQTGEGTKIFVKANSASEARRMFDGEFASLQAMYASGFIRVPKPMKVMNIPDGGAMLAMEYLDIRGLSRHAGALGEALARLHKSNAEAEESAIKSEGFVGQAEKHQYVDKFGFDVVTCTGYLPQDNVWDESWPYGDKEVRELWSRLQLIIPQFFEGLDITPAFMHGDLWDGNVGELETCPVVFDPARFYGHSEYELSIGQMFGGFDQAPRNHFGTKYRASTISTMKKLVM